MEQMEHDYFKTHKKIKKTAGNYDQVQQHPYG